MSEETPDLAAALEESIAAFRERYRHPTPPAPVHGWTIHETDPVLDGPVVVFKHEDYGQHTIGGKAAEGITALIKDATLLAQARQIAAWASEVPGGGCLGRDGVDALSEWLDLVGGLLKILTEEEGTP